MEQRVSGAGAGSFTFRPITAADNAALFRLIQTVVREHEIFESDYLNGCAHEAEDIAALYRAPCCAYWVIEDAVGRIAGGGGYGRLKGSSAAEGIAEVQKMYFLPECRGLGLGRQLLERIMEAAKADGYRTLYIESHPKLTRAIALYERYGFTPSSERLGQAGHDSCTIFMRYAL